MYSSKSQIIISYIVLSNIDLKLFKNVFKMLIQELKEKVKKAMLISLAVLIIFKLKNYRVQNWSNPSSNDFGYPFQNEENYFFIYIEKVDKFSSVSEA